jgi:hypothetical protein
MEEKQIVLEHGLLKHSMMINQMKSKSNPKKKTKKTVSCELLTNNYVISFVDHLMI